MIHIMIKKIMNLFPESQKIKTSKINTFYRHFCNKLKLIKVGNRIRKDMFSIKWTRKVYHAHILTYLHIMQMEVNPTGLILISFWADFLKGNHGWR